MGKGRSSAGREGGILAGGMKTTLLALCPALLLVSCAAPAVRVTHTDVATGAVNPKAIYIRPFRVASGTFDRCTPSGNAPIRESLLPVEFADNLQEELCKIAPAKVLASNEDAPVGWLVDGEFRSVESGYSPVRWSPLGDAVMRKSCLMLHVRVSEARRGTVLYEFDVAAGTKEGSFGSVTTPGMGYPLPFDRRNAAELIAMTLTPDPFRYGARSSPEFRY